MADAAVSMLIQPLISTIDKWLKEEISLIKNVKDKLKEVSSKLRAVQDVLDDAEKQSVTKESVKDWLDELRYISYEMDDVLDEWNTSVSKRKLEEISCSSFSTCCISPVKHVGMRRDIAWKINDIDTRLDSVVKQIKDFDFALNQKNKTSVDDSLKTNRITNSIIKVWEIEKVEVELFPHLYLSYNELSPELKKCFSYCTLFPKNSKIDVRELIRYWMAQGYVTSTKGVLYDLESKAKEYFEKLATSCFFQEFENDDFGNVLRCKMHNIVHDFALYLTRNENITIENKTQNSFSEKARHVSWLYSGRDNDLPLTICGGRNLRSIIVHDRVLLNPVALIGRLECVRSLVLTKCHLEKLPKEMGSLVHLRVLDLSDNDDLDELPESICELYNLQTLDITRCRKIKRLPERIGKLINLRHLLIALVNLENYPKSFESLTNLRKLTHFIVGRKFGKLEYLQNFKHLRGNLNITIENNDLDVKELVVDAEKAELKNNKNIQELLILFKNKEAGNEAVWEALLPPTNLQKLTISNFFGTQYPSWLTNHSHFTNLRFLRIDDSTCSTLPPLWKLSCLETLMIWSNSSIKHIGREFLGIEASSSSLVAFPKLIRLTFLFLFELEVWEDLREEHEEEPRVDTINNKIQILPRLRELRIWCSEKLRELPHRLLRKASSLECLEIRDCGIFLDNEKDDTEIQRQQQQLEQLLSHIPKLKINDLIYTPDNPAGMKAWSM